MSDTERELPFAIDDERTILIYGLRYSMGIFQYLGLGPVGSAIKIVSREGGVITLQLIHDKEIAAAPDLAGALRQIAKGEGSFSLDHLEHACNTIEDMKALAVAALEKAGL